MPSTSSTGVVPTTGTAQNGYVPAYFGNVSAQLQPATWATLIGSSNCAGWILFNPTYEAQNRFLISNSLGPSNGIYLSTADTSSSAFSLTFSMNSSTPITITGLAFGRYHLAQWQLVGTTARLRVNSAAFTSVSASSNSSSSTYTSSTIAIGCQSSGYYAKLASVLEVAFMASAPSDPDTDLIRASVNSRYALSPTV